jgi:hypothetical protein
VTHSVCNARAGWGWRALIEPLHVAPWITRHWGTYTRSALVAAERMSHAQRESGPHWLRFIATLPLSPAARRPPRRPMATSRTWCLLRRACASWRRARWTRCAARSPLGRPSRRQRGSWLRVSVRSCRRQARALDPMTWPGSGSQARGSPNKGGPCPSAPSHLLPRRPDQPPPQVADPVRSCVSAVYAMLVSAAHEAAAAAGANTEAALSGKAPLNAPEFHHFIMPAVVKALDEWRAEAETSEPPLSVTAAPPAVFSLRSKHALMPSPCKQGGFLLQYVAALPASIVHTTPPAWAFGSECRRHCVHATQARARTHHAAPMCGPSCLLRPAPQWPRCWWTWSAPTSPLASSATPCTVATRPCSSRRCCSRRSTRARRRAARAAGRRG